MQEDVSHQLVGFAYSTEDVLGYYPYLWSPVDE